MILFPEPTSGLSCLSSRLVESAEKAGLLPVRVGLATGQVVPRDGDIFGQTVNLAARISSVANPAQVVVSESAMAAVATGNPGMFNFAAMEPTLLKGLPVLLLLVRAGIASSVRIVSGNGGGLEWSGSNCFRQLGASPSMAPGAPFLLSHLDCRDVGRRGRRQRFFDPPRRILKSKCRATGCLS